MRVIHWFRKDLRLDDNTALHEAHTDAAGDLIPVYVSEPAILARPDLAPVRVGFVLDCLAALARDIEAGGGRLIIRHGDAAEELLRLARQAGADAVYFNAEYEPDLLERDARVAHRLTAAGIRVKSFPDRFLVEPGTLLTGDGKPYTVYTPFRRASEAVPNGKSRPTVRRFRGVALKSRRLARLDELGLSTDVPAWPAGEAAAQASLVTFVRERLDAYATDRDRMDLPGTSRLAHHLRFGTLSPRQVCHAAEALAGQGPGRTPRRSSAAAAGAGRGPAGRAARTPGGLATGISAYLSEVRWRDFYGHVLYHFPRVLKGAFKPQYDNLPWMDDRAALQRWRRGRTGYPIVDAAMRELCATGWMHNRARMIVASFLTKDLLIDWRRGERWFMNNLVDGDPASNNGGWQWAASTGTDAQPYFRIFNPVLQGKKFDPQGDYVRRWVPELAGLPAARIHEPWGAGPLELESAGIRIGRTYPERLVDHAERRELALALYRRAR